MTDNAAKILAHLRRDEDYEPTEAELAILDANSEARVAEWHRRGWFQASCGCCGGLQWGGEELRECRQCDGAGSFWVSPNGRTAVYPGGPFLGGVFTAAEVKRLRIVRQRSKSEGNR